MKEWEITVRFVWFKQVRITEINSVRFMLHVKEQQSILLTSSSYFIAYTKHYEI